MIGKIADSLIVQINKNGEEVGHKERQRRHIKLKNGYVFFLTDAYFFFLPPDKIFWWFGCSSEWTTEDYQSSDVETLGELWKVYQAVSIQAEA